MAWKLDRRAIPGMESKIVAERPDGPMTTWGHGKVARHWKPLWHRVGLYDYGEEADG